jgi:hypothetical protein
MTAAATDRAFPFLSEEFDGDAPPSLADGVAMLLQQDRQIILVMGKRDGRMGGFLADLTHSITKRDSLLRIKSPLTPEEFHRALAGQLGLPPSAETPVQPAARVGQRLRHPAPTGRYVLLCEGADRYAAETLEVVRQISNYPVSIVLAGSHALKWRLRRASLAPLRQRITHQLALTLGDTPRRPFRTAAFIAALSAAAITLYFTLGQQRTADLAPPRPISSRVPGSVTATQVAPLAPATPETADRSGGSRDTPLALVLEQRLAAPPAGPNTHQP